jgi:hypothetical protein
MNSEDALQFVQERLRHDPSHWGLDARRRDVPRVRRRFAVQMAKGDHRSFERVDDSVLVVCASGSLWITHDGDPKDVIVSAGEQYRAAREDAMHLFALQPCVLEIQFDDDVVEH